MRPSPKTMSLHRRRCRRCRWRRRRLPIQSRRRRRRHHRWYQQQQQRRNWHRHRSRTTTNLTLRHLLLSPPGWTLIRMALLRRPAWPPTHQPLRIVRAARSDAMRQRRLCHCLRVPSLLRVHRVRRPSPTSHAQLFICFLQRAW
jgi:hypothetical protein